jgi:hypothetical protein
MLKPICLAALLLISSPVFAQTPGGSVGEVVVTGSRRDADNYDASVPAVGLRRLADYAVQEVVVTCDMTKSSR